ncbi:hypothetical protein SAMN05444145_10569 [Alistipes timonensis JC136]|uniref:Uncharacterized protein n=1 Tax=Alistipes timonensis JC136 TaxID=1033731 RepID=A0A1H4CXY7_9BACT|nr:hypothetical protein [Alistipes timonensis]SEA65335.1 hypothetical protein SAMN05444145_10569 [Alistipes timonensis JC136]
MKQPQEPVFEPMPETPAEPESPAPESAGQPAASLAEAKKNILAGLLWCVGGLAFSFISYYFTEAGGRYVIATGAVLWGAWQAITGLYIWLKIKYSAGEYTAFRRMLAAAVCTALLIGYLTVLSTQLVNGGGELPLLDTEQTYDCPDLGLRIRIPAGYTAVEEAAEPETDSTYARYTMYVLDGEWEFNIDALQNALSPDAESITDISDYCQSRDSAYYDGGIIKASRPFSSNGIDMLRSEGRRTEYPGFVFTTYDLKQGQSLITVGISYPANEYGKTGTLQRIEELLQGIELTESAE